MRRTLIALVVAPIATLMGVSLLVAIVLWNWPSGFEWCVRRLAATSFGLTERTVSVRGDLWPIMERAADGASPDLPPLLLLHGFGTSKEALTLVAAMRPSQLVIAPDLPGFGAHPLPDGVAPTAEWFVEQVESLRAELGLERFDLGGTSMGGALAAAYAAAHPDRVERLVLLAPAGVTPPIRNDFMAQVDAGQNPLDLQSVEDLDRIMGIVFVRPPPVPTPLKVAMIDRALALRPGTLRIVDAMRPFLLGGLDQRLASIAAPTLVLYGECDRVTDPSMAQVFDAGVPVCHVVLVPDAGHVPFADAPGAVSRAMSKFLDSPR